MDEDVTENLLQAMERELRQAAVRARGPARGRARTCPTTCCRGWSGSSASTTTAVYKLPGPLDLTGLNAIADLPIARAAGTRAFVPNTQGGADRHQHLRRPRRARHARAPPLRLVHHQRAAPARAGRRRPAGAGDQADAVPDQRRVADRRRPDRRGRGGQAGRRGGRDQGPVRRAGEHRLGAQARGGGLPRRLRLRRPEDARQAHADRPPGTRRHPAPLLPHRHRQLPPDDRPAV